VRHHLIVSNHLVALLTQTLMLNPMLLLLLLLMLPCFLICFFNPAAQNLVLMMQLQPGTASLAPATARLLLQMYTLAVLPVTLWVSVFAKLVL
jgi:hypothetical protein